MKKRILITLLLVLLLGGLLVGYVMTMPTGGGSYVVSPDGRMKASATNYRRKAFLGMPERRWIEYEIAYNDEIAGVFDGDTIFQARYEQPGDCRYGSVRWDVTETDRPGPEEIRERERNYEGLGIVPDRVELESGTILHTVTFNCGVRLVLESQDAVDAFRCVACLPRVSREGLGAPRGSDQPGDDR